MSITISAVGNLGRDPEIATGDNGRRRARFSLACSRKRAGDELTTWLSCTVFQDGLVGVVESFCTKGRQVFVSGEFSARPYTAKDGSEKLALELVVDRLTLCGSRQDHGEQPPRARIASDEQVLNGRVVQAAIDAQAPPRKAEPDFDDSIPF